MEMIQNDTEKHQYIVDALIGKNATALVGNVVWKQLNVQILQENILDDWNAAHELNLIKQGNDDAEDLYYLTYGCLPDWAELHVDPHGSLAVNLLVDGEKHWLFFDPTALSILEKGEQIIFLNV